jgi:hypothetical protein
MKHMLPDQAVRRRNNYLHKAREEPQMQTFYAEMC